MTPSASVAAPSRHDGVMQPGMRREGSTRQRRDWWRRKRGVTSIISRSPARCMRSAQPTGRRRSIRSPVSAAARPTFAATKRRTRNTSPWARSNRIFYASLIACTGLEMRVPPARNDRAAGPRMRARRLCRVRWASPSRAGAALRPHAVRASPRRPCRGKGQSRRSGRLGVLGGRHRSA